MTDRIAFAGPVELEGRRIKGSVVLAGSRTFRNGEWLEVDPAAVVKADASDVIGRWEHDPSKVLGRSSNGTVRVSRSETGIDYEIDVPDTSYGNDLLELMRRGDIRGSSFEIEGLRSVFSTDPDGTRVRRITSIKRLSDVSPVTDPAFVNSTAAAFSKEPEVADIVEEPAAAPDPKPAATFAAAPVQDDKSSTYRTAQAFAEERDIADLESAMDNLVSLGLDNAARSEAYAAFADVYDRRKAADKAAAARRDAVALAHDMRKGRIPSAPASSETFASEDYAQAFGQYLRTGNARLMEQFAQSISGDGSEGGFTVPDGFLNRIGEKLKAYGGIARVADEITTGNGESLRWPYNDDTANTAAIAAEGVAGAAGADLVFSSITLGAFSYDANGASNVPLKVSLELIQDSAFDLPGYVGRKLGERIGRKQASDLATGAGTTLPFGLLSKTPDTMTATAVSLAGPEHIFQVDSAYRDGGNCRWVMSDTNLVKLWTSQTTTNQPLFIPGGSDIVGAPGGTFYGYPVTIDPNAGTLVAFGDIRAGYIVRRVRGVQLLVDPYTVSGTRQIAYHAWARMDANIQDPAAYSVSEWSTVSADT
jgi:HK97 family phage major capsid protein/HK97 family phage prohead protease